MQMPLAGWAPSTLLACPIQFPSKRTQIRLQPLDGRSVGLSDFLFFQRILRFAELNFKNPNPLLISARLSRWSDTSILIRPVRCCWRRGEGGYLLQCCIWLRWCFRRMEGATLTWRQIGIRDIPSVINSSFESGGVLNITHQHKNEWHEHLEYHGRLSRLVAQLQLPRNCHR